MTQEPNENCLTDAEKELKLDQEAGVFVFPASFVQQRLWFLAQLFLDNPFYNVATTLTLIDWLNASVMEQPFNEIVRRHGSLMHRLCDGRVASSTGRSHFSQSAPVALIP